MKKALLFLFVLLPSMVWAGDHDDFGTWIELGIKKYLPHSMSVGLDAELRTRDASKSMDRISFGADAGYKVNKYFKLGISYSLLSALKPEKYTDKSYIDKLEGKNDDGEWKEIDAVPADASEYQAYRLTDCNGYNYTPEYWEMKHRFCVDVNGSKKIAKLVRISIRERYQFTATQDKEIEQRVYREKKNRRKNNEIYGIPPQLDEEEWKIDEDYGEHGVHEIDSMRVKIKSDEPSHILRSRIKFELDKKKLDWSPFISVEFCNNLASAMKFEKLRSTVGTSYKLGQQHEFLFCYVWTLYRKVHPFSNLHTVSLSYNFAF